MIEVRQCSGSCGPDGAGRVLPLTEEYFHRRMSRRVGLTFSRRCKDCVLSVQRALRKRQAAWRNEIVKYLDTVPRERRARRRAPEAYWQETAEERSARLVDTLIARLPWDAMTVIAWLLLAAPAVAHDNSWYSELMIPGSKQSCCNDRDCRPVPDCSSPGELHRGVVIEGRCIEVAPHNVLPMDSPDGQAHACWSPNSTPITIHCAVFPPRLS